MAVRSVLTNQDLLSYIANFTTNDLHTFIKAHRNHGIKTRFPGYKFRGEHAFTAAKSDNLVVLQLAEKTCKWINLNKIMICALTSNSLKIIKYLYPDYLPCINYYDIEQIFMHTSLDIIKWLHSKKVLSLRADIISFIAMRGDVCIMEWLDKNFPKQPVKSTYLTVAARKGNLAMIKWLHNNYKVKITNEVIEEAAKYGDIKIVSWLQKRAKTLRNHHGMLNALSGGHFHIMRWFHHNRFGTYDAIMEGAAYHGDLNVVQWIHTNIVKAGLVAIIPLKSGSILGGAICQGHVHIVKWLIENGYCQLSIRYLNLISSKKLLEMIQLLYAHKLLQKHNYLVEIAATSGNLQAIKWYNTHISNECPTSAVYFAVKNNHMEVVKYLIERDRTCITEALRSAVWHGRMEIIKYFYEHYTINTINAINTNHAANIAAEQGHLDLIIWLYKNTQNRCTLKGLIHAVMKNELEIVKLIFNYHPDITGKYYELINHAICFRAYDVLEWLHCNYPVCTASTLKTAAGKNNLALVQWLTENYFSVIRTAGAEAIVTAVDSGGFNVVKYLYENYEEARSAGYEALRKSVECGFLPIFKWLYQQGSYNDNHIIKCKKIATHNKRMNILAWIEKLESNKFYDSIAM